MAADITCYLMHYLPPIFNDFILTPKLINLAHNKAVEVEEFKLYNKYYIQYSALIRGPKYMKQRTLYIWKWGEDIQLKSGSDSIAYYYCYLYKRIQRKQELLIVLSGRTTAIDHLVEDHYIDKIIGVLNTYRKPNKSNQPTINKYLEERLLNRAYNFKRLKQLLIW